MSYYIGIHAGQNYNTEEYTEKANALLQLVTSVLNDGTNVHSITKGTADTAHSEIEVSLEPFEPRGQEWEHDAGWELVLKAVVDLEGQGRLQLDKGRLSSLLRGHKDNQWALKIEKKVVPKELEFTSGGNGGTAAQPDS